MTFFLQSTYIGLTAAGVYLLVGLGLTMVFGLTRLINFGHGQLLVLGTFIAYSLGSNGAPFVLAATAATFAVAAVAAVLEFGVFRRTLGNPLNGLIAGLGVLLVGEIAIVKIWGKGLVTVKSPLPGSWRVGALTLSQERLVVLLTGAVCAIGCLLMLRRTKLGNSMRAAQQDPLAAAHAGINVGRTISVVFILGSAAAGLAGAMLGTLVPIDAYQGGSLILKGFAVALLGGLGSVQGCIAASVIYGIGETYIASYFDPSWVPAFTFGVIVLILLVRPGGLTRTGDTDGGGYAVAPDDVRKLAVPLPLRLLGLVVVVVAPLIAFSVVPTSRLQSILILAAIYTVLAFSLSLLYHNVGMLSLANTAFMAAGAYTAALLAIHLHIGFWGALVPACAISAVVGIVVGVPVARAKGHYFLLLTFAFGELAIVLLNNGKSWSKGDEGLLLPEAPSSILGIRFDTFSGMFRLAFLAALLSGAAVWAIGRSRFGARLSSIRENEPLARSLGLQVSRYKVAAFGISGGIAGLSGVLFVYYEQVVVPGSFDALIGIQFIVMVVLGGRSLLGPPVGVIAISVLPELFGLAPDDRQLAYGLTLILVTLLLPPGLVPSFRKLVVSGVDLVRSRTGSTPRTDSEPQRADAAVSGVAS